MTTDQGLTDLSAICFQRLRIDYHMHIIAILIIAFRDYGFVDHFERFSNRRKGIFCRVYGGYRRIWDSSPFSSFSALLSSSRNLIGGICTLNGNIQCTWHEVEYKIYVDTHFSARRIIPYNQTRHTFFALIATEYI
jgi:hypothetical protein